MEAIINYLDKYTTQIFIFQIGLMFILTAIIAWVYFYNRKKYNHLKHQIPASVVKNYLDSIIQNSTSLKSSLFRGGGLDVDTDGIPSVMPLQNLESGASIDLDGKGDAALKAEVTTLRTKVLEKEDIITDLEGKTEGLSGAVAQKQERIDELEAQLQSTGDGPSSSGADNSALEKALEEMTQERDVLKEELAQYAMVEDEIADLKRLKQENEQLKKSLAELGGTTAASEAVSSPEVDQAVSEQTIGGGEAVASFISTEDAVGEPVEEAAPVEKPAIEDDMSIAAASVSESGSDEKSPEDLLSEFEKMLG